MRKEILIAGIGGQGVLVAGHILGLAAAKYMNYYVSQSEEYSAETRGGESRADVVIATSDEELDYPKVRKADIVIILHSYALNLYKKYIKEDAIVLIDEILVSKDLLQERWRVYAIPLTKLAEEHFETRRVANMIALGALASITNIVTLDALKNAVKEIMSKKYIELNIKALELGFNEGLKRAENA